MDFVTTAELEAALPELLTSPTDEGELKMVVRRPQSGEREVLAEGELDLEVGLVGDSWSQRSSRRTPDGSPHPDMQLNLMNYRILSFLTGGDRERMALAGDQLIVDLDLSEENLPPGTVLDFGGARIEVTDQPHTGCAKFSERFGLDARRFLNSPELADQHLRGINAKVITAGTITPGSRIQVTRP